MDENAVYENRFPSPPLKRPPVASKRPPLTQKELNLSQRKFPVSLKANHRKPTKSSMSTMANVATARNDNEIAIATTSMVPRSTMPAVLLPTRSFDSQGSHHDQQQQQQQRQESKLVFGSGLKWQGTDPLTWIESIAAEAEARAAHSSGGKVAVPIRVNGVNLSLKRPMHFRLTRPASSKKEKGGESNEEGKTEEYDLKADDQRKRVRSHSEDEEEEARENRQKQPQETGSWDFAEILNDDMQPKALVHDLQGLASSVESMESISPYVRTSYQRIRGSFSKEMHRIHEMHVAKGPSKTNNANKIAMLGVLYNDTKVKMEALIRMATEEATRQSQAQAANDASVDKKDFASYMTAWLRDNWTNPYPDDDGLTEMADACNTTSTVVSNWLINARTRKWRPAIVKAFEMNRPSELLLEDSLNIFDGNPVRDIPVELSESGLPQSASAGEESYEQAKKRAKY